MLAEFDDLFPHLRCPINGDSLTQTSSSFVSESGLIYPAVNGQPLLVDWEHSVLDQQSVLQVKARSVIRRSDGRLRRWIKRHLLHGPADETAESNATDFVREVRRVPVKSPLILVIGGGTRGIGTNLLYDSPHVRTVGLDIYASESTHLVADAHRIPFASGTFDGVWIQYVLEHVLEPWTVVAEIERVLKSEGVVYSETPFLQQVHESGYDFCRFTHGGHRWLFRGFEELASGIAMGVGSQVLWTVEHLVRGITRSRTCGKAAKLAFFWLRYVEKLIPARYNYDSASSFFFLGRKCGVSMLHREIVPYYRGAQ